jgi:hypothetical protein
MPMELVTELPYNHPYRWDGTQFGGPVLWRPSNIGSDLALWLDAEDSASITLNGSTVSQWNDKSGNGRNVSQATAASQPTYSATGWESSKPAIVYNNKILENTTASLKLIARSLFVVVRETTRASLARVFTVKTASGNDYGQTTGYVATTGRFGTNNFELAGSAGISYRLSATPDAESFGIYGEVKQAGLGSLFRNGTLQATDSLFTEFDVNSAGGFRVGAGYSNVGLIGNIAEVIYLESTVSTAERQLIEGYLAWKWGGF